MTWKPRYETYCSGCFRMVAARPTVDLRGLTPGTHYRYRSAGSDPLNQRLKHTSVCYGGPVRPDVRHGMEVPEAAFGESTVVRTTPLQTVAKVSSESQSARFWWWAR